MPPEESILFVEFVSRALKRAYLQRLNSTGFFLEFSLQYSNQKKSKQNICKPWQKAKQLTFIIPVRIAQKIVGLNAMNNPRKSISGDTKTKRTFWLYT